MKETNLQLLIEYKPQDYGGLYVSLGSPQREHRTADAAQGGDCKN